MQFITQDTVNTVSWYRNGVFYSTSTPNSLGNDAYSSTLVRGSGYTAGEVWTVQIQTSYNSYYGTTVTPVYISSGTTITVLYPPSITSLSPNTTVLSGSSVTLDVIASGTAPRAYQWSGSSIISGATNSSYTLSAVRTSDAGNYTVIITNLYGSVTSGVVVLTVNKATPIVSAWPSASGITYLLRIAFYSDKRSMMG